MPFFSIIIPAYNRSRSIGRAVGSCLAQDMEAIEVIVVDDGSTDDTPHQVAKFMDPRVVYVRQENAGASAARNRGARVARGKYLAFLDSDDEFLPGKLSRFAAAIEAAGPEAEGIVWYSPLYFQRGEGNRLLKPDRPIGADERVGDYLFATDGLMQTSTLVIESRLFDQVRLTRSSAIWTNSTSACDWRRRARISACSTVRLSYGTTTITSGASATRQRPRM